MCVTDRHDMTVAVKVALSPNTTNQPYLPTVSKNFLCLILQMFLYLETFKCNTTFDWINRMV